MTIALLLGCVFALGPAILFLRNLFVFRPLPAAPLDGAYCSVLIPARNEEENIGPALRSALQSRHVDLELVVLDDDSVDRTAEIVRALAGADRRIRLERARHLPAGWCGKSFACHQLATAARYPILVFMDADVRISRPDALARLAYFLQTSGAALVSGIPRQETHGWMEKLIVPLIHFILLGFLPLRRMRRNTDSKLAAACGQIIAVRADAYEAVGGHAGIARSLHDGLTLARKFRSHGYKTDLFDATNTFACRMYHRPREVWAGFAKNAREGLGSRRLITPSTLLLLGGQVLPFCLLFMANSRLQIALAALACLAACLPRLISIIRFRQSILGALLHPFGVFLLVAIQWYAFARDLARRGSIWKGRSYLPVQAV